MWNITEDESSRWLHEDWMFKRDLCTFFLSHPCFAYLCRVTAVDRTASVTAGRHRVGGPGCCSTQAREGRNEHRKLSMRAPDFTRWIGAQANQTWPCHAACSFFATTMQIHIHWIIQTETLLCYLGLQWQRSQPAQSFLVFLCQRDSMILFYDSLTYCPFFDEKLNQYSSSAPSTWQMQSELFT